MAGRGAVIGLYAMNALEAFDACLLAYLLAVTAHIRKTKRDVYGAKQ